MVAHLSLMGHRWPVFQVCAVCGFAGGSLWAAALAAFTGLSIWVVAMLAIAGMGTFLALAMAVKVVTGEETLVYYHHQAAVLAVSAALLWACKRPVLPYLHLTAVGLGIILACGRAGCLMAGCCHGRPHRIGVRYGDAHVAEGFPPWLADVKLFPVQAVESIGVIAIASWASASILRGEPAGAALARYIEAYGATRFLIEFLRGDAGRPHLLGLSEPQWISAALMAAVACAEAAGLLPFTLWHAIAAGAVCLGAVAVVFTHRSWSWRLAHPKHLSEIAVALQRPWRGLTLYETSLGVRISSGTIRDDGREIDHYAISGGLTEKSARAVATLIASFHARGADEFIRGGNGVFHLLMRTNADKRRR